MTSSFFGSSARERLPWLYLAQVALSPTFHTLQRLLRFFLVKQVLYRLPLGLID
jgi:hypothetical protein